MSWAEVGRKVDGLRGHVLRRVHAAAPWPGGGGEADGGADEIFSDGDLADEFMDAEKFDELREDTEGAFGGVGMVVGRRRGMGRWRRG